jgi:hypothetical protein
MLLACSGLLPGRLEAKCATIRFHMLDYDAALSGGARIK